MTARLALRISLVAALGLALGLRPTRAGDFLGHKRPCCPPYCSPTFGYYPTAWRPWPSVFAEGYNPAPGAAPATLPMPAPEGKAGPVTIGHRTFGPGRVPSAGPSRPLP